MSKNGTRPSQADILNLISSDVKALSEIGFEAMGIFRSQINLLLGCSYIWFLLGKPNCEDLCTDSHEAPQACGVLQLWW